MLCKTSKYLKIILTFLGLSGSTVVKNLLASAGDTGDWGLSSGSGRSPAEGNGSPLQYPCLENPMDGEAWQATVHRVAKTQTQLSTYSSTNLSSPTRDRNRAPCINHWTTTREVPHNIVLIVKISQIYLEIFESDTCRLRHLTENLGLESRI